MASRLDYSSLAPAIRLLRDEWQVQIIEGESLKNHHYQFAGDDALRLRDLQRMLDDSSIRVIFSARGGYGSYRLIERLDFTHFLKSPKWIVGFSDITVIHCHLHRLGVQSLHATMPRLFGDSGAEESVETLRRWLFGEPITPYRSPSHKLNRPGQAEGPLIGGNLTLLMHTLCTSSDVDFNGKLLFIEDIGETLFSIDRMVLQLKRAGRLSTLAGLLVGQFSEIRHNESAPFGQTVYEIIAEHVADYSFPVCFDFPVGHVARNLAIPVSHKARLEVSREEGGRLQF